MDIIASVLIFTMYWKLSTCIQCYKCDAEPSEYVYNNALCSYFDYSDTYKIDCEYSTTCYKKVTTLDLGNGVAVTTVSRGCASQVLSGDQEKVGGKWKSVKKIYDEYQEGCTVPHDPEKVPDTTICYCKGHLCNTAPSISINVLSLSLIVSLIVVYLI